MTMRKNWMKTAVLLTAMVGMVVCTAAAQGSSTPKGALQQKETAKKPVPKKKSPKADSAFSVLPRDTLTAGADSLRRDSLLVKQYSFKVITEPESTAVFLDDSLKGATPCTLSNVLPGGHVLTLKKKGYYLKKAEIAVDSTSPPEFTFTLLKPAFLCVISEPAGATVSIDGQNAGTTPYENDKVKPGDHALKVERKQYVPVERSITMENGGRDTVRLVLEHTAAYKDSAATAKRTEMKLRKDRNAFAIVSAIFCLCAIVLIVIEANNQ
jgi:hypothetical protein